MIIDIYKRDVVISGGANGKECISTNMTVKREGVTIKKRLGNVKFDIPI